MSLNDSEIFSAELLYEKLNIPKKYLQRLLTDLAREGFIKSSRGRKGGFTFAKPTDQIFLSEIIELTEGFSQSPNCIFGFGECAFNNSCALHDKWESAHSNIVKMLASTSLSDLKAKT
jgi:Rrf2 family protein